MPCRPLYVLFTRKYVIIVKNNTYVMLCEYEYEYVIIMMMLSCAIANCDDDVEGRSCLLSHRLYERSRAFFLENIW